MGSNRGADSRKKRGAARHAAGQAANEAAAEKEQFQGVLGRLRHTSADRAREAGRTAGGAGAPATGGRFAIGEMDSGGRIPAPRGAATTIGYLEQLEMDFAAPAGGGSGQRGRAWTEAENRAHELQKSVEVTRATMEKAMDRDEAAFWQFKEMCAPVVKKSLDFNGEYSPAIVEKARAIHKQGGRCSKPRTEAGVRLIDTGARLQEAVTGWEQATAGAQGAIEEVRAAGGSDGGGPGPARKVGGDRHGDAKGAQGLAGVDTVARLARRAGGGEHGARLTRSASALSSNRTAAAVSAPYTGGLAFAWGAGRGRADSSVKAGASRVPRRRRQQRQQRQQQRQQQRRW
jgi:hypothetical protein